MVITLKQRVRPARGSTQAFVLNHGGVGEQFVFDAFVFQAVVGLGPDTFELGDFTLAVACSAARAIALILRALRFGAEERDIRQRAVATVFAAEHRGFAGVFEHAQWPGALPGVL